MVVGVYDNSGINTLIGYPLNISLELSPSSSFTGINSGLISTTNGSITFKNLRIISSGTFKFIAKGLDLISGSSSDIVINAFSVDSIKLKASVSVISAYFSFTLSVYLFNQIGSAHQVSETVYLTANIGFGGNEATSTSLGIGNFSVYGKEPGILTFVALCNGKTATEQLTILPNILKVLSVYPIVMHN